MGQTCPGFAKYKALYPNRTQCWGDTSKEPTVSRAGRGERKGGTRGGQGLPFGDMRVQIRFIVFR